jgi:hypothetical protein
MGRRWLVSIAAAVALIIAPTSLTARPASAVTCSLTYVITPYLDGDGNVASSALAQCSGAVSKLWVEDQIEQWIPGPGGGDWGIVADHISQCNASCTSVVSVASRHCATSTSTLYFARARFFTAAGWSSWSNTPNVYRDCR